MRHRVRTATIHQLCYHLYFLKVRVSTGVCNRAVKGQASEKEWRVLWRRVFFSFY